MQKKKTVNIKLRNYSTAISKSTSANKILEKQVFEDSSKLKIALKPIVSVDAGLSDKIVYLPASGTIKYLKADRSANKVIIKPSIPGQLVSGGPSYELYTQGETVTLELSGYIWYKIY